jgi:hypothetical protein
MKEYLNLNKSKFFFQFIVNFLILSSVLALIILFDKEGMIFDANFFGYIFYAIPIIILSLLFINIVEAFEFKRTNKIFSKEPFSRLLEDGFEKTFSEKQSRYLSSKPILVGSLDNYDLKIEIEKNLIRVIVNADLDLIEESHMAELKSIFGKENVQYDVGVALLFNPSRQKNLIYKNLKSELIQFVNFLSTHKIKPWQENIN